MRAIPGLLFSIAVGGALLLSIALGGVSYLFVLLLNAGSELDDARSQTTYLSERNALMLTVARKAWIGRDTDSVEALATELEREGVVVRRIENGSFELGDVVIEVKDGAVTQLRYFD